MENLFTYKGYTGSIELSVGDNVFFGKITGIKDTITFEGDSVAKLSDAFKEAVEYYIVTGKVING
jgi:predicted HicB family RNase H-like nuclease